MQLAALYIRWLGFCKPLRLAPLPVLHHPLELPLYRSYALQPTDRVK